MTDKDEILLRLKQPIVLVGLMGAGKTKIGGLLAEALGLPFIDADHAIEESAQCTIPEIFERYGEPAFRDLERKVLTRLMSQERKVIATGGGAVMNDETANLIWGSALSLWLKADLEILVERTGRTLGKRPLLQKGNPREILQGLMDKRYPVYARADVTVETTLAEPEANMARVLDALAVYLKDLEGKRA